MSTASYSSQRCCTFSCRCCLGSGNFLAFRSKSVPPPVRSSVFHRSFQRGGGGGVCPPFSPWHQQTTIERKEQNKVLSTVICLSLSLLRRERRRTTVHTQTDLLYTFYPRGVFFLLPPTDRSLTYYTQEAYLHNYLHLAAWTPPRTDLIRSPDSKTAAS